MISETSDLFAILGVTVSSTDLEIAKAYRVRALRAKLFDANNQEAAEAELRDVCFAYDILSDAKKRAIYVKHGVAGLQNGFVHSSGRKIDPTTSRTTDDVFDTFFGTHNPFEAIYSTDTAAVLSAYGAGVPVVPEKPADELVELLVPLSTLYTGGQVHHSRRRLVPGPTGVSSIEVDALVSVPIVSGYSEGTRITYPGQGPQYPGKPAADLTFVVKYEEDVAFDGGRVCRVGDDLVQCSRVTLAEALGETKVAVTLPSGEQVSLAVPEVVYPGMKKAFPGLGFVKRGSAEKARGDLVLEFEVVFPTKLSSQERQLAVTALSSALY